MKPLALIVSTLFVAAPAFAQNKIGAEDSKALTQLIQGNMAEVQAGKLAQEKASGQEVKDFAKHMVDDHSKMLQELQQMAQSKGVKAPSAPDAKHQAEMKKLQAAPKDKFDQAYMQAMVKDHKDTVKLVEKTAKSAKDSELKAAAQKAEPDIKEHLKMAQGIAGGKGSSSSGSSSDKKSR